MLGHSPRPWGRNRKKPHTRQSLGIEAFKVLLVPALADLAGQHGPAKAARSFICYIDGSFPEMKFADVIDAAHAAVFGIDPETPTVSVPNDLNDVRMGEIEHFTPPLCLRR